LALAVVKDLRVARAPATAEDLEALETDVLAGFVLARAAAGLSDGTISSDVVHLEQVRAWFGRPLWEMEPTDADAYFGKVLRATAKGTRLARAQAIKTFFLFLELRHKAEPAKVRRVDDGQHKQVTAAVSGGPPVVPKRKDGRSLPPA
jgi:hypothetical protein